MYLLTLFLVAAALGASCSADAQGAPTSPSSPDAPQVRTIVAFGDSLTSGRGLPSSKAYPAVLERDLQAQGVAVRVLNHGVSGETTADGLRRINKALAERPDILILAFGANDGLRGVPVAQVRANLAAMIEAAQAQHVAVLLCGMEALPFYGWSYTLAFHQIFPSLAAEYHIPLVPFMLDGVVANQAMLQPDLAHPNEAGAREIAKNIGVYIAPMLTPAVASGS